MSHASLSALNVTTRDVDRDPPADLRQGHRTRVGMVCFLCSETAFFGTLIVAYITYLGQSDVGPTPAEALRLPLVIAGTIALLSSSFTVHFANSALRGGRMGPFHLWLALTIALGALFLAGTALEWRDLIFEQGLTINRNLFGTTYFTLVGFHGLHVTVGLILLAVMLSLSLKGAVSSERAEGFEVTSWYWHFVDSVWIVVFAVVYVFGR